MLKNLLTLVDRRPSLEEMRRAADSESENLMKLRESGKAKPTLRARLQRMLMPGRAGLLWKREQEKRARE